MKSYRDYLNDRGIPEGPWIVDGPRFQSATGIEARSGETGTGSIRRTKARPEGVAKLRLVAA